MVIAFTAITVEVTNAPATSTRFLKKKIMDKAPKFCGGCGRPVKIKTKTMRYDKQTGKPINWVKVVCNSFAAKMGWGDHTKIVYDENGDKVDRYRLYSYSL